jgi:hypothetical protein
MGLFGDRLQDRDDPKSWLVALALFPHGAMATLTGSHI